MAFSIGIEHSALNWRLNKRYGLVLKEYNWIHVVLRAAYDTDFLVYFTVQSAVQMS